MTQGDDSARHSLATITDPEHGAPGGALARIPTAVKVLAVLVPLLGALTFVGLSHAAETAEAQLAPERLAFAEQTVDRASAPQVLQLVNTGREVLHVDDVVVSGPNHGAFTLVETSCIGEVPAGGSCSATVVFTPALPGAQEAVLSWRVREIPAELSSSLSGTGVAAPDTAPTVSPDALVFAAQPLNIRSAPLTLRVTAGSGPLRLTGASVQGVESGDFLVDGDGCAGAVLAAHAACAVGVRFTPSAVGARSALLTVTDADGHPAATVSLQGSGALPPPPAVAVTPASLRFGDRTVGTASAGLPVTLANRGAGPIDVGAPTIAGPKDFAIIGNDCPARLAPGAVCTTTVTFTPTGAGPRDAQLLVGAPGRPSVPLHGSGIARPVALPGLAPSPVAFGNQEIKTVSAAKTVSVTNRADQPVHVDGVTLDDAGRAFRVDAADCADATLPKGGTCRVAVRFAPGEVGAYSGVLSVAVRGGEGRPTTTLTGTAVNPGVAVPDLVGLPQADAAARLDDLGLHVGRVEKRSDPNITIGSVVASDPRTGRVVSPGSAVDLVVSTGPSAVVPTLRGLTPKTAEAALLKAGLTVGATTHAPDDTIAKGRVVDSNPAVGERVKPGTAVDLVVSSGPPPKVPEVVGLTVAQAQDDLKSAGLTAVGADGEPLVEGAEGTVVSTVPAAGAPVPPNKKVRLTVQEK
jgi:hypothetical protein